MGNIFSSDDYSNPEILGREFPLFEENLNSKITFDEENLDKQTNKFSSSTEDWDYRIGNWINTIPYLWRCKNENDWRTCSRTYLFPIGSVRNRRSLTGRTKISYIENFFLAKDFKIPETELANVRVNGRPVFAITGNEDPERIFSIDDDRGYTFDEVVEDFNQLLFNYPENIVVRDIADKETYYNKQIPEKERFVIALYIRYLQKKYPNVCFPLFMSEHSDEVVTKTPSEVALVSPFPGKATFIEAVNMDIAYVRLFSNETFSSISLHNAREVIRALKNCFQKGIRFVCLIISLIIGNNFGHANLMIIDRQLNKIYIIDPWGEQTRFGWEGGIKIPYQMFVNNVIVPVSRNRFWLLLRPEDTCPRLSFQSLEEFNNFEENDPGGFCYLWSLYIADLLMSNPDEDFREVINKAIAHIKSHHKSFRNFIRAFAVYIYENFDEGEFVDAGPRVKYDYLRRIAVDYERYLTELNI